MKETVILGAGSWGTALAVLLGRRLKPVKLWARREELLKEIAKSGINSRYLPGIRIPPGVELVFDLKAAVKGSGVVVLCIPSHGIREVVTEIAPLLDTDMIVLSTAKGLEENSLMRPSQVLQQIMPPKLRGNIAVMAGPSHAEEVAAKQPAAVVVASATQEVAEFAQDLLMGSAFRVYTNPDVIGVELGGALKNVIALATGMADGLGFGDNTRAALMTRGMVEISRLGVRMGARPATFGGLAGIGDLIVTCTSMHSRNRRAGIQLGQGKPLEEVLQGMGMVVEGVRTAHAVNSLAQLYQVDLPISREVYEILFQRKSPLESVGNLMERGKTHEVEEIIANWGQC